MKRNERITRSLQGIVKNREELHTEERCPGGSAGCKSSTRKGNHQGRPDTGRRKNRIANHENGTKHAGARVGMKMSTVLNFFKEHPRESDPLHKELAKMPALRARLQAIQQDKLACCGAEAAEDGTVRLSVVNKPQWDALVRETESITARLRTLDEMVQKLDVIFEDAEKQGISLSHKTPLCIRNAEVEYRKAHLDVSRIDRRTGNRLPTSPDPRLVALAERAEAVMAEAGL